MDITEECARVLAPHGTLVVELGDTYSGSGGAGGDYAEGGMRDGQPKFRAERNRSRDSRPGRENTETAFTPRPEQGGGPGWPLAKSLCLIPELYRVALVYGFNPLTGRTTEPWRARNVVRWCLDGDTVVYARTPKGEGPTRLLHLTQNFQPGQWDLWDGERWTPVLGWSATEADDAIEIEFRNGEKVSATREHQWPTDRGLVRTDELTVGDVVPSVRLPDSTRPEPAHLPSDDIGWLVGLFLADGSFDSRGRIQIAAHVDEVELRHARLERIAHAYDGTATAHTFAGNEAGVVVRSDVLAAAIRRYIGGTNARNKSVRAAAWRRSNLFLDALLDGYLEGDGHYDAKNDRWRLGFTDNPWLARDLRVLCARLGYRCKVSRKPRTKDSRPGFSGAASFYHRGEIRKQVVTDNAPSGEVVALRQSRRRRFFDVGVEGEPHLFALGSGLLTHNCRPNPPVGALGDKFRPATSEMVVACKSGKRWFDLDAVREPHGVPPEQRKTWKVQNTGSRQDDGDAYRNLGNPAGAPPLDWWEIPTSPYKGSHYATYPEALCVRPIKAMCPPEVCTVCGEPRRRILGEPSYIGADGQAVNGRSWPSAMDRAGAHSAKSDHAPSATKVPKTLGWTDCGHDAYRPGRVLDIFGGSGTTLAVAVGHGRDAVGIDLDQRNADLARERVGPMFFHHLDTEALAARLGAARSDHPTGTEIGAPGAAQPALHRNEVER